MIDILQTISFMSARKDAWRELHLMACRIKREREIMDWQQAQQQDEEALHKAALEALEASLLRPLSESEAMALAYSAGLANDLYKELRK